MDKAWSVNPVALAQWVTGQDNSSGDWSGVQPLLEEFFKVKEEMVFEGNKADPARLQIFQDLANTLRDPLAFAELRKLPLVQKAIAIYGERPIELALPFLVPVTDAEINSHAEFGDYLVGDVSFLDPVQGNATDCYLISAMIALAWSRPAEWGERIRSMVHRSGQSTAYRYAFYGSRHKCDPSFAVPPRLPADSNGRPAFARSSLQLDKQGKDSDAKFTGLAEGWTPMLEKAFAMWRRPPARRGALGGDAELADYHNLSARRLAPQEACAALAGGTIGKAYAASDTSLCDAVRACCDEPHGRRVTRQPVMAWTFETTRRMHGLNFMTTGLVRGHAYAVLGIMTWQDKDYVVLRNPWGIQPDRPDAYAPGLWSPGAGLSGVAEVELGKHGVFAIRADWFNKCFNEVGWVRR